jgi:hypothetical protein
MYLLYGGLLLLLLLYGGSFHFLETIIFLLNFEAIHNVEIKLF